MQFWKKLIGNYKQLNCYKSIDELPIKIWFDIHKTGDYRLLLLEVAKCDTKMFVELSKVWEGIFNEYMEEFGLSEEYIDKLNKSVSIAMLKADLIITGQRHLKTMIKIEEEKLKMEASGVKEPLGLEKTLAKMSKYYGFKLSSRDLTTKEYYSYIHNISK